MPLKNPVRDAIKAVKVVLPEERNDEEVDAAIDHFRQLKQRAAELSAEADEAELVAIKLMRERGVKKSPGHGTLVGGSTMKTDHAKVSEILMTEYPAIWKRVTGRVLVTSLLEKEMLVNKGLVRIVAANTVEKDSKAYIRTS